MPETNEPNTEEPKDGKEGEKKEEKPWWLFQGEDWETKGNEKKDRDHAFESIWKKLMDPKANTSEKVGAVILAIVQYFYRRKQNGDKLKEL